MNLPSKPPAATAADYLEHARVINTIAGRVLKLETNDATALETKISIGLSLQAAELAGKCILRSLGFSIEQIRQQHGNHDVLSLLRRAECELRKRPESKFAHFHHFLLWSPIIDGTQFSNTIAGYFECHFAHGAFASPRNYFYPDEDVFTGSKPIKAIFIMVQHIIDETEKIVSLAK